MSALDDDDPPVIHPAPLLSREQWFVFRVTWPTLLIWSGLIILILKVLP